MVLPQRNLGATQEYVLARTSFAVLFLDLDFHDVRRMLDDLGDVRFVVAANFAHDPFSEVTEAAGHPVLPESAVSKAKGFVVCGNHAEGSVNRPEDKEDDEQVVDVPKPLIIGSSRLFDGGKVHGHDGDGQDIPGPAGTCQKIQLDESQKSSIVLG